MGLLGDTDQHLVVFLDRVVPGIIGQKVTIPKVSRLQALIK